MKWVVELDWDKLIEVLGIGGVKVIMILVNYCFGSFFFFFEKIMLNGVFCCIFYCGDFCVCFVYISYLFFKLDLVDFVIGKLRY